MQKVHDEQNIIILNKDRNQPCSCVTLPPAAHPVQALG